MDYYGPMTSFQRLPTIALCIALACQTAMAEPAPPETVPNSSLGAELFYELLVGEMSARNGDTSSAYALLLDAARKANSEKLYARAVELALAGRSGESALIAAQAWLHAFPASVSANRYVLQILIGMNRLPEALPPLKRELAATASRDRAAVISLLPRYFARTTDKKFAASIVEQALANDLPSQATGPAAWAALGSLRLMAGDAAGAMEATQRGAELNPQSDEVAILALSLMDAQEPNAEAVVRKYLSGHPRPDLRMAYARRLASAQRFEEAYIQARTMSAEAPAYADGWLLRGSLELQSRQASLAALSLRKYVDIAEAGAATVADGDAPEADRGLVQAYLLLSQIAEQEKRLDEAQAWLARITNPQDAMRVQSRRAGILARQGRMEEARALLRAIPESKPEDARLKISAEVQLLRDFKHYDKAYAVLTDAIKVHPDDTDLLYDQAMAAEKVGNDTEMERSLRRVMHLKPDYYHAYNALGYSLADRKIRLDEARQLINKALEFAPNDPFILDSLGWVEFRSGNLTEALRILRSAYLAKPDAEIAAHLGEVFWRLDRTDEAKTTWKEGLALNPENNTLQETMQRLDK